MLKTVGSNVVVSAKVAQVLEVIVMGTHLLFKFDALTSFLQIYVLVVTKLQTERLAY